MPEPPTQNKQYSFKKVPRAPPPTWAYRVRPAPKSPPRCPWGRAKEGLPALPTQELQGRAALPPEPKKVVAREMTRPSSGSELRPKLWACRPGRTDTQKRQGQKGRARLGAVARGGTPKNHRKRGVESPVRNSRKTDVTPDGNSTGEATLPASPSPRLRALCANAQAHDFWARERMEVDAQRS